MWGWAVWRIARNTRDTKDDSRVDIIADVLVWAWWWRCLEWFESARSRDSQWGTTWCAKFKN